MIQYLMIKKLKHELLYYLAIVIILAFIQHPDLFTAPLTRFQQMQNVQNYFHPLLWASILYLLMGVFRVLFSIVGHLKNQSYKDT